MSKIPETLREHFSEALERTGETWDDVVHIHRDAQLDRRLHDSTFVAWTKRRVYYLISIGVDSVPRDPCDTED